MDAAVSTLTALAIFASTVEHGRFLPPPRFLNRARRVSVSLTRGDFLFCLCSRLQERARVQGAREEKRRVGPVGEVGGAAVRPLPLLPTVPRGRPARRRAADTASGVAEPAGVPRGTDRGHLALHCGIRLRRRRHTVHPAAARALPPRVWTIRSQFT